MGGGADLVSGLRVLRCSGSRVQADQWEKAAPPSSVFHTTLHSLTTSSEKAEALSLRCTLPVFAFLLNLRDPEPKMWAFSLGGGDH